MNRAVNKMMKIEALIKSLKEEGCSVFCVDNDKLVLEIPSTTKKNEKIFEKEFKRHQRDTEINGAYAVHFDPKCNYDYTISLH